MAGCPPIQNPNAPPDPPATISFLKGDFKVYFSEFLAGKATDPRTGRAYYKGRTVMALENSRLSNTLYSQIQLASRTLFKQWIRTSSADSTWTYLPGNTPRPTFDMNMTVVDFMKKFPEWRVQLGPVKGIEPKSIRIGMAPPMPETMTQFAARGGYLIYSGMLFIEKTTPSWLPKDDSNIEAFYLGASYTPPQLNPFSGKVTTQGYFKLIVYGVKPSWWDRAVDWIKDVVRKACELMTGSTAQQAAAFAAAYPGAAQYGAAWQATASICGLLFPKCEDIPVIEEPMPEAPPWWQRKDVLYAGGAVAALVVVAAIAKRGPA